MNFARRTFRLRPASTEDIRFAWPLYKDLMKPLTVELLKKWNDEGQKQVVEQALGQEGTSIIVVDGIDVGWLHVSESSQSNYLGQLYLAPSLHNQGIGTAVMRKLMDESQQAGKALTLDVMKNNRARSLYERLGFQVIGESEYKLKMRWPTMAPRSASN